MTIYNVIDLHIFTLLLLKVLSKFIYRIWYTNEDLLPRVLKYDANFGNWRFAILLHVEAYACCQFLNVLFFTYKHRYIKIKAVLTWKYIIMKVLYQSYLNRKFLNSKFTKLTPTVGTVCTHVQ